MAQLSGGFPGFKLIPIRNFLLPWDSGLPVTFPWTLRLPRTNGPLASKAILLPDAMIRGP